MWEMSLSYKLSLLVYLHGQPVDTSTNCYLNLTMET